MPTILLGMPNTHGLREAIKRNLSFLGFKVIDISYNEDDFQYAHLGQKAENFFRKTFLKDTSFKNKLKYKQLGLNLEKTLENMQGKADYALLFRADIYPLDVLKRIKEKSHMMINYQWDGIKRFPAIMDSIDLYDRFFVFAPEDIDAYAKYNVLPSTNFYFDFKKPLVQEVKWDFYFRGTYLRERMPVVETFFEESKRYGYNTKIEIYSEKTHTRIPDEMFTNQSLDYLPYLDSLNATNYMLDFANDAHDGLSFRIYEAMWLEKKLIINNKYNIKECDFYKPENIFVWDGKSLDGFKEFMEKPYQKLDVDIKEKYSFTSWIKYVLNLSSNQEIISS